MGQAKPGTPARARLKAAARKIANEFGIPVPLFYALISAESGWNPSAVSPAGATGLSQLMPGTARGLGVKDPFDPIQNMRGGAKYLASQFKAFKKWDLALAAYNAGPGAVKKYGGIPPYSETQAYIKKVLKGQTYGGLSPAPAGPPQQFVEPSVNVDALFNSAIENLGRMAQGNFSPIASLGSLAEGILTQPAASPAKTSSVLDSPDGGGELTGDFDAGGKWAGSLAVADRFAGIAKEFGLSASGKRDTKLTSSGNVSDHWVGSKNAFAYDLSAGVGQMNKAAHALARALGISWDGKSELIEDVYKGKFRIQIIYNTPKYGGHEDHIHLGVRRVK